ncbi:hypothetical protein [Streptomyces sp. NPDC056464]|uniref:hypothetical protein n=1 Tax=Streptomyces sp. NPDC056464 TaxID=3345828 RepID=UPI0036C72449
MTPIGRCSAESTKNRARRAAATGAPVRPPTGGGSGGAPASTGMSVLSVAALLAAGWVAYRKARDAN